ncbi:MAG: hypothetical protein OXD01_02185 [Gammaproteobacteria bacterium]|nr:hypothetical protein [Gammaproteobacteria bacterium]
MLHYKDVIIAREMVNQLHSLCPAKSMSLINRTSDGFGTAVVDNQNCAE